MRRRLIKLGVFLLLGAVVNVAVAWILTIEASWQPLVEQSKPEIRAAIAPWPMPRGREADWHVQQVCAVGVRYVFISALWLKPDASNIYDQVRERAGIWKAGWPTPALTGRWHHLGWPADDEWEWCMAWKHQPQGLPVRTCVFPFRPLWPGFAVNTLFYAVILWFVFAAPFALRRRRRVRCGLCPHCKYPVGASPVCTECGSPVKPKPSETAA